MDARNIFCGLLYNNMIGPMMDLLKTKYERPVSCYKMIGIIENSILRNLIKFILWITGNHRVIEGLKYGRPLSNEELKYLMLKQQDLYKRIKDKFDAVGIEAIVMP